jgi:hypothetical protein
MAGSKNSKHSQSFDLFLVILLLAALSSASAFWFFRHGYSLYYGDAEAHLNIARRIVDSRMPGYFQIGTVWLPLPHVLMLPLVENYDWWRSGFAGVVPPAFCFVLGGAFFFAATRRALGSRAGALSAICVLALNPNLLYLQSAPMTEVIFLAALAALLYFTVRFRDTQSIGSVMGAALAALAGTLTRYEGWFLIPFVTLFFLVAARRRRWMFAVLFGVVASLGPLYWLAHNWWYYGDVLEFYHGPYSAKAIYQRALEGGMARYPGDHDWRKAWLYFRSAAQSCAGWPLILLAITGAVAALFKRAIWPLVLLALPPIFYVWSIHSGATPIYVPHLWPNTYYNTRYGLSALPALAFATGALVAVVPARLRAVGAIAIIVVAVSPWLRNPRPEAWICWKESQVNSRVRLAWTKEAAAFLRERYQEGTGIFMSFGDLTGILRLAGIPVRESLYDGNVPNWDAVLARPDLFLREQWAIAIAGDKVSDTLVKASRNGPSYECLKTIAVKGGPVVQIYKRDGPPAFAGLRDP